MIKSRQKVYWLVGMVAGGVALVCTCGPLQQAQEVQQTAVSAKATIDAAATTVNEIQATIGPITTMIADGTPLPGEEFMVHQWASTATASSQYTDDGWAAFQATGAPNVDACGDDGRAWASATQTERATLTLTFEQPVIPARILVTHSYYPSSLVQVEVVDLQGTHTTVMTKPPLSMPTCPFTESVTVTGIGTQINTVILTVDQAQIGAWDEIDAVELVGTP